MIARQRKQRAFCLSAGMLMVSRRPSKPRTEGSIHYACWTQTKALLWPFSWGRGSHKNRFVKRSPVKAAGFLHAALVGRAPQGITEYTHCGIINRIPPLQTATEINVLRVSAFGFGIDLLC